MTDKMQKDNSKQELADSNNQILNSSQMSTLNYENDNSAINSFNNRKIKDNNFDNDAHSELSSSNLSSN